MERTNSESFPDLKPPIWTQGTFRLFFWTSLYILFGHAVPCRPKKYTRLLTHSSATYQYIFIERDSTQQIAAPCICTGVIFQKLELIYILVVRMWANVFWRWRHTKLLHRANATISIPLLITVWDILHWLMFEVIIPKQWPWKFVLNFPPFQPFLGKEWLVKTNSSSSTPYLFVSVAHDSSYLNINQEFLYCQNARVFRNLSPPLSIWHALYYSRIPNLSGVKVITTGYPPESPLICYLDPFMD